MALLDDIGGYIDTNTALTLGTNLFLSLMPETVDNCVVVVENAGIAPTFTMGSVHLPQIERPEVQIVVRNTSYSTGRSTAETVYRLLTQITNQTINGNFYHRIDAIASPALYERDINKRVLFSTNFHVMRALP